MSDNENDIVPADTNAGPTGLSQREQTERDTDYSPSSDRETAKLQHDADESNAFDEGVDEGGVQAVPGTGGPDDVGATSTGTGESPATIAQRGEEKHRAGERGETREV